MADKKKTFSIKKICLCQNHIKRLISIQGQQKLKKNKNAFVIFLISRRKICFENLLILTSHLDSLIITKYAFNILTFCFKK